MTTYNPSYFKGQVPPEEIDRFLDWFEREFGLGNHRPKPTQPAPLPAAPRDRGEGRFGTEGEPEKSE